jgi:hypothetical protein
MAALMFAAAPVRADPQDDSPVVSGRPEQSRRVSHDRDAGRAPSHGDSVSPRSDQLQGRSIPAQFQGGASPPSNGNVQPRSGAPRPHGGAPQGGYSQSHQNHAPPQGQPGTPSPQQYPRQGGYQGSSPSDHYPPSADYHAPPNHYYGPRHGGYVGAPPPGHRIAHYGSVPYYYYGGYWYRPFGSYYYVTAPPIGLVVSFLPDYYTTLWFGSVPYYFADNVYYARRSYEGGYVVTDPPQGTPDRVESTATAGEDFFMYPRNGQSAEQQAQDRYECHRWAVEQTGFDPTQSQGGVPVDENGTKRSDYLRAITACLEGRGYTVR